MSVRRRVQVWGSTVIRNFGVTLPTSEDPSVHMEVYQNSCRHLANSYVGDWGPCFCRCIPTRFIKLTTGKTIRKTQGNKPGTGPHHLLRSTSRP